MDERNVTGCAAFSNCAKKSNPGSGLASFSETRLNQGLGDATPGMQADPDVVAEVNPAFRQIKAGCVRTCPDGSCCDKFNRGDSNGIPSRPGVAQAARNYNAASMISKKTPGPACSVAANCTKCDTIPFCGWCAAKSVCMDERNVTGCPAFTNC